MSNLNLKLNDYGIDDVIDYYESKLELVAGNPKVSKKEKDAVLCEVLGFIKTLHSIIDISEECSNMKDDGEPNE